MLRKNTDGSTLEHNHPELISYKLKAWQRKKS